MQISNRFTLAVYILVYIETFKNDFKVSSEFLARSTNVNPSVIRKILILIAEARTELLMKAQPLEPDQDQIEELSNSLIEFIGQFGAPKEIRVSNIIVEAALEEIYSLTRTKIRRVRKLQAIDDFVDSMGEEN